MGHRQQEPDDLTEHHVIPRSRQGADDETNILFKPIFVHQAWHHMIVNAKPKEVIELFDALARIERGDDTVIEELFDSVVYKIVFRNMTLEKALELIKKRWKKQGGPWELVFGRSDVPYSEAVLIIEKEWMMP